MITLFGVKTPVPSKDLSKSGSFFLLIVPQYWALNFLILSMRKLHVFSEKYACQSFPVKA